MWKTCGLTFIKLIQHLFTPTICVGCNAIGASLCRKCNSKLVAIDFQRCLVCDSLAINGKTHQYCTDKNTPHQLISPFEYQKIAKKMIIKSKHGQNSYSILEELVNHTHSKQLLVNLEGLENVDYIIPIPMSKQKGRMVNHSVVISQHISENLNIPILNILHKNKKEQQKSLSREDRLLSTKKLIGITNNPKSLNNKTILLVDDITTTGATLMSASKVLMKHGVKKMLCYTICKDMRYNRFTCL